jgi:flagellar FliL protein
MPDKKSSKKDNEDDEKSGGSKRIVTAAIMSVAMLGGGFFIGGKMSGGAAAAPVAEAATDEEAVPEEKTELGELVDLEAVNVNLQDGHFLRIAVTLELDPHKESGGGHGAEEAVFPAAPAADLVLTTFSGRAMDELATASGREAARETLLEAVTEAYHGDVVSLYFTEFVMQ